MLAELAEAGDTEALARQAAETHPADIAEYLDTLKELEAQLNVFDLLAAPQASEVVRKLSEPCREALLEALSDQRLSALVEGLDTDDAADLLGDLPEGRRQALLFRASPETRRVVGDLLAYPEDSAGGIMKTELAPMRAGTTVGELTDHIRTHPQDFRDVHNIFVTAEDDRLLGAVPIRELILARTETLLGEIMDTDVVSVGVDVDQEEVAHLFEKYDLLSLPVVDAEDRLSGRITVDDVVYVIEEEATEDMLRLAGVGGETIGSPQAAHAIRARLPWLALNLVTATMSAAAIAVFEETIEQVAIAAAFMTIVASQGGNAGVQTMTLIVRGLALGELQASNTMRILRRESLVALINGVLLGILAGGVAYIWRGDLALSLVLGLAMLMNLLVAATLGSLVPTMLELAGVDPAVSSSVLVTAGTDVLGFLIFLGILTLVI